MQASRSLLLAILTAVATPPAAALDLRVGTGTGCTHATLQAALDAIEGVGGDHHIRINAGSSFVVDGIVYQPTVAQGFVRLEGGYASCTAGSPSGLPTTDAGRSILDGGGGSGLPRSVLELQRASCMRCERTGSEPSGDFAQRGAIAYKPIVL